MNKELFEQLSYDAKRCNITLDEVVDGGDREVLTLHHESFPSVGIPLFLDKETEFLGDEVLCVLNDTMTDIVQEYDIDELSGCDRQEILKVLSHYYYTLYKDGYLWNHFYHVNK